jgi:hypothetical protein
MRRPLLLVALLGIVATVFGVTSGSAATGSLSQARVCGAASFSAGGARCIVDERAGLRSNVLHCSARAEGLEGSAFRGVFSFQGKRFPAQTGIVRGDGWIFTTLSLPGGKFPAGRWACLIQAGDRTTTVGFRTTGARGPLAGAAACPTSRTVISDGVRACRRDLSGRLFVSTDKVTCSATYALADGHTAAARLVYEGKDTGLSLRRALPLPVSVIGMQVVKQGGLPAGDYACVFSLDGRDVQRRAFTIAPASSPVG